MQFHLGPLPSAEARVWTADTLTLLDTIEGDPRLPFALPREAVIEMRGIVAAMAAKAACGDTFTWECETSLDELKALLRYWLNIGKLSPATLEQIGGRFSGPEGERFHERLLTTLLEALDEVEPEYARRLRAVWGAPPAVVDLRATPSPQEPASVAGGPRASRRPVRPPR